MALVSKGKFINEKSEQKTWGEQLQTLPQESRPELTAHEISWILSMLMNSKCDMKELEHAVDVINKLTAMQKEIISRL